VSAWLWLGAAIAAAGGAYLVGWPSWTAYRARAARDLNAERYLAWRGRAPRGAARSTGEGPTGEERRRLWIAGALAVAAVFCLVGFFTYA
jgi:hypothetical protein